MVIAGSQKSHGRGKDLEFKLISQNTNELEEAAAFLEQSLKGYAGVYDVENSGKGNIPEINLKIKPSAEALGLALSDLANQVRAAFYGVEVQRIQRGREEVKVMVRYPRSERESLGNLESMYRVGQMVAKGQGVAASDEKGMVWIRRAAVRGHKGAMETVERRAKAFEALEVDRRKQQPIQP